MIHAEGEKRASAALLEAARMSAQHAEAMAPADHAQVAGDCASTVVLALPLEVLGLVFGRGGARATEPVARTKGSDQA